MLGPAVVAFIGVSIVVTSFISGIFGMAGGLILLGIMLIFLDVAPAMVLFASVQLGSNGWRSLLWRKLVVWPIVWRYLVGATVAFFLMRLVSFVPDKAMVYLTLGSIVFAVDLLPRVLRPDITRPGVPYICGLFIMALQLVAGAAGHVLDMFFQKSDLDRRAIVATKAVCQTAGHMYRIAFFSSVATAWDTPLPAWQYVAAIGLSLIGTSLAAAALMRMSNETFRQWSRRIVVGISAVYLARGAWLLAVG